MAPETTEPALAALIARSAVGDEEALTALVRRYQNMVFGYALSLVHDRELAEDVTQETFIAAVAGLGGLRAPHAFPGWLRGIARNRCRRVLRARRHPTVPLERAEQFPSRKHPPDVVAEQHDLVARILTEIGRLPLHLQRAVTLYYIEDYTHEEIGAFLGVPASTVNNWVHAARTKLREQALSLVGEAVRHTALEPGFAANVGRIVRVLGPVVDVQFESAPLPRILNALTLASGRRVMHVVAVPSGHRCMVRCVVTSPGKAVEAGAQVFDTEATAERPVPKKIRRRAIRKLGHPGSQSSRWWQGRSTGRQVLETGIKVIDLLAPLPKGGRLGVAGDPHAGKLVLIEELVHRIATAEGGAAFFGFVGGQEIDFARQVAGRSPASERGIETFYLLSRDPKELDGATRHELDASICVSRKVAHFGIYPAVDPGRSWSALLEPSVVGADHFEVASRVRLALESFGPFRERVVMGIGSDAEPPVDMVRAAKLALFMSQPFHVAETHTGVPGSWVRLGDTVDACRSILDGGADDIPVEAFRFTGTIADVRGRL